MKSTCSVFTYFCTSKYLALIVVFLYAAQPVVVTKNVVSGSNFESLHKTVNEQVSYKGSARNKD